MNPNLSPLTSQGATLSQSEMLGKLAEQGIKVSVNHESKAGMIEANGRQFSVKLVNVNGEHPLDADTMTQVATRLAYMLFSKDLLDQEFQGAKVGDQGIQLKDGRSISHEQAQTKELYQDMKTIMQERLTPTSSDEPVQQTEPKTIQQTEPKSLGKAEALEKQFIHATGLDQHVLNAINKYGVSKVIVDGAFSQERFEALEKAEQRTIQAQQNPKTSLNTRLKGFLSRLTQTNKIESARIKSSKHTVSNEVLSEKLKLASSEMKQYTTKMAMLQSARDGLTKLPREKQKEAKEAIKEREKAVKNHMSNLKALHKELSRYNLEENGDLKTKVDKHLPDLDSLVKASDPHAASLAYMQKHKLIPDEELNKKLNLASFEMKQYTKEMAMLQKTRDGLDKLTPDQQIGSKKAIEKKEAAIKNHMQNMKALHEELSGYNLKKNKDLKANIEKQLPDLESLVNASDPHAASLAYIEKYKTISDFQSGIVSGYTAAWSEKYPFRKPEEPANLIIGHQGLMERDPANKASYQELVSIFQELHSALEEASKTFGPATQGTVNGPIIRPETTTTPEIRDAQQALRDKIANLKQRAEGLTFTTNDSNKLPIPTVPNLGQFSVANLLAAFKKIDNDLTHFDNLRPRTV